MIKLYKLSELVKLPVEWKLIMYEIEYTTIDRGFKRTFIVDAFNAGKYSKIEGAKEFYDRI